MNNKPRVIMPGSTIGVLGGGQLGRMMALQGSAMGYRFMTLDPTDDAPCGQVASEQIVAGYDDAEAAQLLAQISDVITYEFENVDADVAALLEEKAYVPQGSQLLAITQHRLREKAALTEAGVEVAPYRAIHDEADLVKAVAELGLPCVLKTTRGGYDGKGQFVIRAAEDIQRAYASLSSAVDGSAVSGDGGSVGGSSIGGSSIGGSSVESGVGGSIESDEQSADVLAGLVCEQFVPFVKELSVIAARSPNGEVSVFPVAENVHVNNILHVSIVPARVDDDVARRAEKLAVNIAESLQVVGLIAVEMFLTESGELYVNELAPRPHNSGHYSMDACQTSQFEQHIRAICNLPLTSTELMTPVVMVNVLGEHLDAVMDWMASDGARESYLTFKTHLYGKRDAKVGRKMGHINILTPDIDLALGWIERSGIW